MSDPDRHVRTFAKRRDEESFRLLFREHTPAVLSFAVRLHGGSRSDAEDLVQEMWIRAVERIETFAFRSAFRSWLIGILVNCYRERRRRPQLPSANEGIVTPEEEKRIDLDRAVERLPDGAREVLLLHEVQGYTHEEIGELLGISPGTSKSQLHHARRLIRDTLDEVRSEHDPRA